MKLEDSNKVRGIGNVFFLYQILSFSATLSKVCLAALLA